ncbi:hypothetical protein KIPB_012040, partial [Kipferlia bialata]
DEERGRGREGERERGRGGERERKEVDQYLRRVVHERDDGDR